MSQSQHQQPKPHHTWFSTQSFSENSSNFRAKNMAMQVPTGLLPMYDDIQVAAVAATAKTHCVVSSLSPPSPSTIPRKKGTAWTESEHKLFLIGLKKFGKGDWKSISRFSVLSRTPCQVASHAQKYFLRQNVPKKKRKSIHDITLEESEHIHLSRPIDHHNSVPLPQNHCLDITPEGSGHFSVPHYNNHQNFLVPMAQTANHQNSILQIQNRDHPSQNCMYRTYPEMLQAQPLLPPNNFEEYQYRYSAMFNSFGCFNPIR